VTFGERLLDVLLGRLQVVQRLVQLVGIDFAKTQQGAESVRSRGVTELPRGGELGGRFDDAGDDHGEDEFGQALRAFGQDLVQADLVQRAECGRDMAVAEGTLDREALARGGLHGFVGQHPAQSVDLGGRPFGQIGQSARLDLALLAVALAQQHGGRGVPVGDGRDVHAGIDSRMPRVWQELFYMPTILGEFGRRLRLRAEYRG
jgi:hypothetical protein